MHHKERRKASKGTAFWIVEKAEMPADLKELKKGASEAKKKPCGHWG